MLVIGDSSLIIIILLFIEKAREKNQLSSCFYNVVSKSVFNPEQGYGHSISYRVF